MTKKRSGLGRGLEALIPAADSQADEPAFSAEHRPAEQSAPPAGLPAPPPAGEQLLAIALDKIVPNPRQPRSRIDAEELAELAGSIRSHGILQPLIVSWDQTADRYTLIAGERRLLAARQAGLDRIPVVVRAATDRERLELALIENIQRTDLTPLEAAQAYQQLASEFELTQAEIADRVGKSRVAVANTMRLLKLAEPVREALANGQITEGHARAMLGLSHPEAQTAALQTVLRRKLTVRQAEDLIRKLTRELPAPAPKPAPPPELKALEEQLRGHLGTKVTLQAKKRGGTLTIHYYSDEELNTILDRLLPPD